MSDPRRWLDAPDGLADLDCRLVQVGKELSIPKGSQALGWSNLTAILGPGIVGGSSAPSGAAPPAPTPAAPPAPSAASSCAGSGLASGGVGGVAASGKAASTAVSVGLASGGGVATSGKAAGTAVSVGLATAAGSGAAASASLALVVTQWAAFGALLGAGALVGLVQLREGPAPEQVAVQTAVVAKASSSSARRAPLDSAADNDAPVVGEAVVGAEPATVVAGSGPSQKPNGTGTQRSVPLVSVTNRSSGTTGDARSETAELKPQVPLPEPEVALDSPSASSGAPPPTEAELRQPSLSAAARTRELRAEALRLAKARNLLERNQAKAALSVLSRRDGSAPAPALSHEREALTIEALWRAGHQEAARQRARLFVSRSPTSPLAGRVRSLVGLE